MSFSLYCIYDAFVVQYRLSNCRSVPNNRISANEICFFICKLDQFATGVKWEDVCSTFSERHPKFQSRKKENGDRDAALKLLLENKMGQRRAAEATDVTKTRRPSTRSMHRPRRYYLFYSWCTWKSNLNRDASSDIRVIFFNFINHLDRKIYQWNNWSVLNDNFSYKSQHFYPWKWPIVVVEFQEINFALCIEFHSSRNSFSEFWFLPTPLQDTREKLTAIDTSQLCPVLNFVSFDNTFVWLWKFRTMKTGKKKEGKKLKKSCNAYFSTDVLLHRPAFAMVLHLQTD